MQYATLVLGLTLLGCSAALPNTEQGLAKDAAAEWKCEASDVKVKKIDAGTYHATGCGHEADYSCPLEGGTAGGSRCEVISGE